MGWGAESAGCNRLTDEWMNESLARPPAHGPTPMSCSLFLCHSCLLLCLSCPLLSCSLFLSCLLLCLSCIVSFIIQSARDCLLAVHCCFQSCSNAISFAPCLLVCLFVCRCRLSHTCSQCVISSTNFECQCRLFKVGG